jgi:hypothetical protein
MTTRDRLRWPILIPAAITGALVLTRILDRTPQSALVLRDGDRTISLDTSGAIQGLSDVSFAERKAIAAAIRTHRVAVAPPEPDLALAREVAGGPAGSEVPVWPDQPVGEIVLSERPEFRWSAVKAQNFRVEIFDSNSRPVAASGFLSEWHWRSSNSLRRGALYSWTLSAAVKGTRAVVPPSPEPQWKFRVASSAEEGEFMRVLSMPRRSELLTAITAARLGFRIEAREAIGRLSAENPGQRLLLDRLRDSLLPPHAR